jgi:hypothetical protein
LAYFLIVLPCDARCIPSLSFGDLGLAQLGAERLDLFGKIICALGGSLGLRLC